MSFDEASWKFPVVNLRADSAAICITKSASGEVECIGGRIKCEAISLPDIHYGYERESTQSPEIMLKFAFPFTSLGEIAGKTFSLGEEVEECGEDLGSVYLFGAHNPVGWQSIIFGSSEGDMIGAEVDLYFDFDFEDRIGSTFRHKMPVKFQLERRWEL